MTTFRPPSRSRRRRTMLLLPAMAATMMGHLPASARMASAISAGSRATCSIQDQAAFCWGRNYEGELGNGEDNHDRTNNIVGNVDRYEPVAVKTLTRGVTAISSGTEHVCAVQDGAALCWGRNNLGQLGNGEDDTSVPDGAFSNVPVAVTGLGSGVTGISAGAYHSCAVQDGAALCWGSNAHGQLGDGSTTDSSVPVPVTGLDSGVTEISAGTDHTCAIRNGAAFCWGWNAGGRIGDGVVLGSGDEGDRPSPVEVVGFDQGVSAISAGEGHTCAIRNGNAFCWGSNGRGELGDGNSPTDSSFAVPVTGLSGSGDVSAISTGSAHACAVQSGRLFCWGENEYGELGDGNAPEDSSIPVAVSGLAGGVSAPDCGSSISCALADGVAFCWGFNAGRLGNGSLVGSPIPVRVVDFLRGNDPSVARCDDVTHYAWSDTRGNIQYSRCENGSCMPARDLVVAPTQEWRPSVSCSDSAVLVAWEDTRNGHADVAYRRSVDGGASFEALRFLVHGTGQETRPVLAMSGNVALAVWEDTRRNHRDLGFRRSADAGLTWSPVVLLLRDDFDKSEPALVMEGNVALLAWVDRRHGGQDIAYRRSTDGGASWLPVAFIVRGPDLESDPTAAVDGSTILLGWTDRRWGNADLAVRRSIDMAATFGPLVFLARAPTDDIQMSVAASEHQALVSWVETRSGNRNVSYRHSEDGGATWTDASRLVSAPTDESEPACDLLAVAASCAWTDLRHGDAAPQARESGDGGATWLPRFEFVMEEPDG